MQIKTLLFTDPNSAKKRRDTSQKSEKVKMIQNSKPTNRRIALIKRGMRQRRIRTYIEEVGEQRMK